MPTAQMSVAEFCDRLTAAGKDPDVVRGCPEYALRTILSGSPVRTNLTRTVDEPLETRADGDTGDGLTISGHWTVFNSLTRIASWEGEFDEQVLPGATKKTLREGIPKMQFDHGRHPLLGSLPLGRWLEAKETEHGSWSSGRMSDNWLVAPFAQAIQEQGVSGMSFRFTVKKEKWWTAQDREVKDPHELFNMMFWGEGDEADFPLRRDLHELAVSEAGPVVWPAYQDTDVSARSADGSRVVIDLGALSERRDAGLVIALLDAEMAAAAGTITAPRSPAERWAPLGRAELARMAGAISTRTPTLTADTATVIHDEPPTTAPPAATHSDATPPQGDEPHRTESRPEDTREPARGDQARRPANP